MLGRNWSRVLLVLAAVLFAALVPSACGRGAETRPESLVPEGSTLVGQVRVAEVLKDLDLAPLYDALPKDQDDPQTFDGLLGEFSTRTGVDSRNVSRATFFADLSRAGGYAGVIVNGGFDEDAVVAAVEKESGVRLAASKYKGRVVHAAEGQDGAPALAVIEGDNMVLGTLKAVQAVIDVQDGDRDPASGGAQDAFDGLGDGLLRLALEVPGDILGDQSVRPGGVPFLGGGAERLPLLLPALGDLKLLGLRVGHEGQTLKFQAQLDFATPDAASAAGDSLNGLVKLAAGLAPGAQAPGALDRLQVGAEGARVTIRLEAAVSDLGRLLGRVPINQGGDSGGP